jgi:hypothetical protein
VPASGLLIRLAILTPQKSKIFSVEFFHQKLNVLPYSYDILKTVKIEEKNLFVLHKVVFPPWKFTAATGYRYDAHNISPGKPSPILYKHFYCLLKHSFGL